MLHREDRSGPWLNVLGKQLVTITQGIKEHSLVQLKAIGGFPDINGVNDTGQRFFD